MKKEIILLISLLFILTSCGEEVVNRCEGATQTTFTGHENILVDHMNIDDTLDFTVTAYDDIDGDVTEELTITGDVNLNRDGEYEIIYSYRNSCNLKSSFVQHYTVQYVGVEYPSGYYTSELFTSEQKASLLASLEEWMMQHQAGGIPLMSTGEIYRLSDRYQPTFNTNNMFYNIEIDPTLLQDDSNYIMYDNQYGNTGEFSFRSYCFNPDDSYPTSPSFNTEECNDYDDFGFSSVSIENFSDYILANLTQTALYSYNLSESYYNMEFEPEFASKEPELVETIVNDTESLNVWRVHLKEDLEWKFHPDTDPDFLKSNPDKTINAYDYYETFSIIKNDFALLSRLYQNNQIYSILYIEGLDDYFNDNISLENIGFKVIDEYTFEITFSSLHSKKHVMTILGMPTFSPINKELYDYYKAIDPEFIYGSEIQHLGYTGEYYFSDYKSGEYLNITSFNKEETLIDNYTIYMVDNATELDDLYNSNKLDIAKLYRESVLTGNEHYIEVRNPYNNGFYSFRINGLSSKENQQLVFPESTFEPEPIFGEETFIKALYYATDRRTLVSELENEYLPKMRYFNHKVDLGFDAVSYYEFDVYNEPVSDFFVTNFGYNKNEAIRLFKETVDHLILEEVIEEGTEENPTVIELEVYIPSGVSHFSDQLRDLLDSYNTIFQYPERNIYIDFIPKILTYQYGVDQVLIEGNYDLIFYENQGPYYAINQKLSDYHGVFISNLENLSEAPYMNMSLLDDWIYVEYDNNGQTVKELWKPDALFNALNSYGIVHQGELVEEPTILSVENKLTSIEFNITNILNEQYSNQRYTIKELKHDEGISTESIIYYDVEITSEDIVIEDLNPNGTSPDLEYFYEVIVTYQYEDQVFEFSYWLGETSTLLASNHRVATYQNIAVINNFFCQEYTERTIDEESLQLIMVTANGLEEIETNFQYNENQFMINDLEANTTYRLYYKTSDNMEGYIEFVTQSY